MLQGLWSGEDMKGTEIWFIKNCEIDRGLNS